MARTVSPWRDVIGQPRACSQLQALLDADRLPSLLFAGPNGIGKRTVALQLARAANCETPAGRPCGKCRSCRTIARLTHPDVRVLFPVRLSRKSGSDDEPGTDDVINTVLESSPAYALGESQPPANPQLSISIRLVRWLRREMARPPFTAQRRFFIILSAHQMTQEAANAFLKILEEPQRQTTIVLTTDRPNILLPTVRSRCRLVRFSNVPDMELAQWLGRRTDIQPGEARLAAAMAEGSPGRALRFLESPDEFLARPALDFFALREAGEAEVLATLEELGRAPVAVVVGTFLFLYRQVLRARHGLAIGLTGDIAPAIRQAERLPDDYLRRVIRYLVERLQEARTRVDRRLFLYTLLSSLRRPN
jgi:DNA polymerase-3 subunit delta'